MSSDQTTPKILNFIPDEVAIRDEFSAHSRVAAAIAEVIQSNRHLKVVGLLGAWGSGKSSVVKFVRDKLSAENEREKVYCFTYDAWLHQNDPPRRAFLEVLIRFLIESELTTEPLWKNRLQELNRQIEDTESTTTPTLSTAGKFLLPSALFVPFGMQLVGHEWFDALSKKNGDWFEHWAFYFGIALVLLPIFTAVYLKLSWRPVRSPWRAEFWLPDNWRVNRSPYEKELIISIFTNKEIITQKNRTIRSPDPSTIEFQAAFKEIMAAVSGKDRRFIFVVDNLDRLPEAEAVEMWSTIRSFFLGPTAGVSLPTVILPIDENAVRRMYAQKHPDGEAANELARSFMDKTFDLTFRVNRPVLSNWQSYLGKQLSRLFGDQMDEGWPYVAGYVYDRYLLTRSSKEPVTPRVINALVNSIGALWLQWRGSSVNFASIVYYVANRENIDANIMEAVAESAEGVAEFDPDWRLAVAALHFGVEPNEAAQVLLEQPLRLAIGGGSETEFARLALAPGFTLVLDRLLDRAVRGQVAITINNAVRLYGSLGDRAGAEDVAAWRQFGTLWGRSVISTEIPVDESQIAQSLLAHCDPGGSGALLAQAAAKLSGVQESTFAKAESIPRFVDVTRVLIAAAQEAGLPCPKIRVAGDPRSYLKAIALCSDEPNVVECLTSAAPPQGIIDVLAQCLNEPQNAAPMENSLRALIASGRRLDWNPVVSAAGEKLQASFDNLSLISVDCLGLLRPSQKAAVSRIQELADSGNLVGRFNEAYNANNIPAAAAISALLLLTTNASSLSAPDGASWDQVLEKRIGFDTNLSAALVSFGGNMPLSAFAALLSAHSTLAPIIRRVVSLQSEARTLPLPAGDEAVTHFSEYSACFEPDPWAELVGRVSEDESFWVALEGVEASQAYPILYSTLKIAGTTSERAVHATVAELETSDAAVWKPAIEQGSEPLGLSRLARSISSSLEIGGNLFEALRQNLASFAGRDDEPLRERWLELADLLSANARKTLFRLVADYISRGETAPNLAHLLSLRDAVVISEGEFERHAVGAATNIVLPLLREGGGLEWLFANASLIKPIVERSDAASQETIRENLLGLWRTAPADEGRSSLDKLATSWGLLSLQVDEPAAQAEPAIEDSGDGESQNGKA